MSDDPDGDVRNAALSVLGIFKGRLGEGAMSNYLKDMNAQKVAKVNDAAATVKPSKYDKPDQKEEKKISHPVGGSNKPLAKKATEANLSQKES